MKEMFYHTTKDGTEIKLQDLKPDHLQNIIKWIERKAKVGIVVHYGGGCNPDDMWYEEDILSYKEGLKQLNHGKYVKELKRRERN